jgi:hypothetical protein
VEICNATSRSDRAPALDLSHESRVLSSTLAPNSTDHKQLTIGIGDEVRAGNLELAGMVRTVS